MFLKFCAWIACIIPRVPFSPSYIKFRRSQVLKHFGSFKNTKIHVYIETHVLAINVFITWVWCKVNIYFSCVLYGNVKNYIQKTCYSKKNFLFKRRTHMISIVRQEFSKLNHLCLIIFMKLAHFWSLVGTYSGTHQNTTEDKVCYCWSHKNVFNLVRILIWHTFHTLLTRKNCILNGNVIKKLYERINCLFNLPWSIKKFIHLKRLLYFSFFTSDLKTHFWCVWQSTNLIWNLSLLNLF